MNKNTIYTLIKNITPPFIFTFLRKSFIYTKIKKALSNIFKKTYQPYWQKIKKGPLEGREIFVSNSESWVSMISGDYDDFFLEYLKKIPLEGKVIFDIGTHIGFNSLIFAQLVGPSGKVLGFEPNPYNKERFEKILTKNIDLAKRITLHEIAISNKEGTTDFVFTDNIEGGTSSGSFIDKAHTHLEKNMYEKEIGFKRMSVKTLPFDLFDAHKITDIPFLIKIDIEGAEYLALEGGKHYIQTYKPLLLIEIHSIFNMYKVGEILTSLRYKIELLKEESDGRCFIAGTYQS